MRSDLERVDSCVLVSFRLLLLGFELRELHSGQASHRLSFFDEFLLQLLQFDLVLAEQCPLVDIFINASLIFDFLSASGKLQSLVRLVVGLGCGRHHGYHGCLTVTTQGVFEEAGQSRVTEGNMLAIRFLCQRLDDVAQG